MVYTEKELIEYLEKFYQETNSYSKSDYEKRDKGPSVSTYRYRFDSWGNAIDAAGLPHTFKKCPYEECGNYYDLIGNHWSRNSSHFPEVSRKQHEIITGLMMGDASRHDKGNTAIQISMTTKKFLDWVCRQFGILGNEVVLSRTAKYLKDKAIKDDGLEGASDNSKFKPQYKWRSVCHPEFNQYSDWYDEKEGKQFPDGLELTPLILKVWYCCDGNKKKTKKGSPYIRITSINESNRPEFLKSLFDRIGVSPTWGKSSDDISFGLYDSQILWDYMEEPLPGFKDKWPMENYDFNNSLTHWRKDEIQTLKKKYPTQGANIEELDRSKNAIWGKAKNMGISYEGN